MRQCGIRDAVVRLVVAENLLLVRFLVASSPVTLARGSILFTRIVATDGVGTQQIQ